MRTRHLQTRFILAGVALVMMTIVSGLWSAWTFARLSTVAGRTIRSSQRTMDLTAALSNALEREDDAFLIAMSGDREQARQKLSGERRQFAALYSNLLKSLEEPDEKGAAAALQRHVEQYHAAGDALLSLTDQSAMTTAYQQHVNPALRRAVGDCTRIRELNFRSMQAAALSARDDARGATILVTAISTVALLLSTLVAVILARSVLIPIQELSSSVEALRTGDFNRRAKVISTDELGELAAGFNRMAEALAEFRRSNLGEVLRAKDTLEATVAALPDAVIVFDPDGHVVTRNPLATTVLEALDAPAADGVETLPFPAAGCSAIRQGLRGERSVDMRADFSRAFSVPLNGRGAKFMLTVVPIPEFWKGRFGAVAILYDVTDFARLDELRMELVGVASHELKTPLTTLRMNLLMLEEDAANLTPRQHEILSTAILGGQELANTIEELLDLTRIEAGQLRLSRELIDVYSVIERATTALGQRFEDAAVTLKLIRGCRLALVRGDPVRLGMVFTNLLNNALKYTPRGGCVLISVMSGQNAASGANQLLHIAVTDSGCGIPPEFRERVFDKFFRIEQLLDTNQSGTRGAGIGLYLCRQIVEAHQGRIWCEPAEDGSGTRLAMDLPSSAPLS
jgi:NtrC-family two-component system sensor histidine kinase KinB